MKSGCCSGHMRKRHFAGCLSIIMPLDVDEHVNILINRLFRFIPEGYVHTFAAWWVVFVVSFSAHRLQWQRSVVLPVHRGEGGRTHVHLRAWDIQGSRPGSRSLTGRESDFWNAHQVRFPRVDVYGALFFFFSPTGCPGLSGTREPEGSYFLLVYKEIHRRASRGAVWRTCHWLNSTKTAPGEQPIKPHSIHWTVRPVTCNKLQ